MSALCRRHWKPVMFVIVTAYCICIGLFTSHRIAIFSYVYKQYLKGKDDAAIRSCPEGLTGLLQGYWEPGDMTAEDVQRMKTFHEDTRQRDRNLPKGLQREDKRCGNVNLEPKPDLFFGKFRALCDPEGPTPCCDSSSTCVNKTVEECRCAGCWDMRTELHAEYATWRTTQPGCQPQDLSVDELCDLLQGGTFFFMGDSLIRQFYTAMLLAVRDDEDTGALFEGLSKGSAEECQNLYMFSRFQCRLDMDRAVPACKGSVLRYIPKTRIYEGVGIRNTIMTLANKTKSVVVIGIGLHDRLRKPKETFEHVLQPLLDQMRQENWRWPLIIWASVHSLGPLLAATVVGEQNNTEVIDFNYQMEELLAPYKASLPLYVFNTFNLTAPVASFDGVHYGLGVNKVKVNVLANFLRLLRLHGVW